jgi:CRP-like cAMP-binding protein
MIDIDSFSKYSLFGGFKPEDLQKIRPLFGFTSFEAGVEIIRECERNDTIFFIQEGNARVVRQGIVILELGAGDLFGEMEVLDVMPAVSTIRALNKIFVATISNRALHRMYHLDPKIFSIFMMNLARDLSRRLRRMDELACRDAPPFAGDETAKAV